MSASGAFFFGLAVLVFVFVVMASILNLILQENMDLTDFLLVMVAFSVIACYLELVYQGKRDEDDA